MRGDQLFPLLHAELYALKKCHGQGYLLIQAAGVQHYLAFTTFRSLSNCSFTNASGMSVESS